MTNRSSIYITLCLLLVAGVWTTSCERLIPSESDQVLARVGSQTLTLDEVRHSISDDQFEVDSLRIIERYRSNWIRQQLKAQEAVRLGLHEVPEVQRRIEQARRAILADAFNDAMHSEINANPPDRAQVHAYYESNRNRFVLAESYVQYRHMISATLANARSARNALLQGAEWDEVVGRYAANPRQVHLLSSQYNPMSTAAREFGDLNETLQVMGITEISSIRQINGQYHFVQVMDVREAGEHPELEWIMTRIADWMMVDQKRKRLREVEQSLYLQAQANNEVFVFDLNLPDREIPWAPDSL